MTIINFYICRFIFNCRIFGESTGPLIAKEIKEVKKCLITESPKSSDSKDFLTNNISTLHPIIDQNGIGVDGKLQCLITKKILQFCWKIQTKWNFIYDLT